MTLSDPLLIDAAIAAYLEAKWRVASAGYGHEVEHCRMMLAAPVTERRLLAEGAWCILSVGLSERAVRCRFSGISEAFFWWHSAQLIVDSQSSCVAKGLENFRHEAKIAAIVAFSEAVATAGAEVFARRIAFDPEYLETLPYFGPASARHLARNIGVPLSKPDRHLKRVACFLGFDSPDDLCAVVSSTLGEEIGVVDLVFWRMSTLDRRLRWLEESQGLVRTDLRS